ncbi:WecB/TagA/CpsF family glycosyltransferase [Rhodococcus sp. IEGM 1374]|uniref:WecB/TagA/CpsF family glycosyltransferase n=1 Tax=Rhodococcus sp. IEGM 1374 TaxID=3082221 RepID=UPI0029551EC1|nr:WecB/TagA/CpsF family glycosyltransferase [Rhodococcus sp. IEGM 1374]MDV7991229.1 WecB/TagA/CpsF family glycosyltransferase [Rhodococcus sp. IEGM 1374]
MKEASKQDYAPVVHVGGIPFQVTSLELATQTVLRLSSQKRPISVRFANAYCVAVANKDPKYCTLLASEGINFPDGAPIVWFMRRSSSGRGVAGRVRGPSLFGSVLDSGRGIGIRHFFLGTTDETLKSMIERVSTQYPGINIAGSYAPRFGPVDKEFVKHATSKILAAEPQIVWVALGTPKQDFATAKLAESTQIPCVGVGAAFDFMAGSVPEAPLWMQNNGVEWIFRLASEPRRLWRRYVFGNLAFLYAVYRTRSFNRVVTRDQAETEATKVIDQKHAKPGRAYLLEQSDVNNQSEPAKSEGLD